MCPSTVLLGIACLGFPVKATTGGGGSVNLPSTKVVNLVSLEQCHHNPMSMYGGGVLVPTLGDHGYTFPKICDGIALMEQGL